MKKIILISAMLLLAGAWTNAQDENVKQDKMFFADIAAGPSFPVAAFVSKNTTNTANSHAGFAETGYRINLNFGYNVNERFGITSHWLFSQHKLDISKFGQVGTSADHWKYYGVLIGPMVNFPLGDNSKVGIKAMAGVSNVNSPSVAIFGTNFIQEKWAAALALQFGADLKYSFGNNLYFLLGADYNFMKPTFKITIQEGSDFYHSKTQEISAVVVNAGIGVKF